MARIRERRNKNGEITSYQIRVYKGKDSNGKELKPYIKTVKGFPKTWSEDKISKELNKIAVIFEKECSEGLIADNKQDFASYAEYVISLKENIEKKKHRTIKRYRELLGRIIPAIGHIKLSELKPQHLNHLYDQLGQPGMNLKTGGKLSEKTILEYHRLIHTILSQAEKELLVIYNAADKSTPPKYKRKKVNYFEIDEVRRIRRYLRFESIKWRIALLLLIYTGGRRGEVCGLKTEHINFQDDTIHFCNNLLYSSERGIYEDSLKTEGSDRIIKISHELIKLIKDYLIQIDKKKEQLGSYWHETGYLLTQENGKPIHPDSLTDYCSRFSEKYNKIITEKNKTRKKTIKLLPHLNPHAFRHTHLSILLLSGVDPLAASKRGGHTNIGTTMNTYGHLLKKADEKAASIFDNAIK